MAFEFEPVIVGKNSFIPIVKGNIEALNGGSRIHIRMTLNTGVIMFIAFICLFLSAATLSFMFKGLSNGHFEATTLVPAGMLLFIYVLATVCFRSESGSSRVFLVELMEGKIE